MRTFLTCHDYFISCPNGAYYNYPQHEICHCRGGGVRCLLVNCDARNYAQKIWRWIRQQLIGLVLGKFTDLRFVTVSSCNESLVRRHFGGARRYIRVCNSTSTKLCVVKPVQDKRDFFYVGRIAPEKGFSLFERAILELNVTGVVVGSGANRQERGRNVTNMTYMGWMAHDKVLELMGDQAAALVFPSVCYETAGMTPLEAMSLGIPCIVSNVTAAVEYVEDGVTGLLFKSGDVEDLKQKIMMMNDPEFRGMLTENIRKRFDISKWSEEAHIEKLMSAYVAALKE